MSMQKTRLVTRQTLLPTIGRVNACQVCGRPLPAKAGRRGRASVYCSPACRQKAYRTRRDPATGGTVPELIADIGERVDRLEPTAPAAFYTDVTELSASVGRLRRVAK